MSYSIRGNSYRSHTTGRDYPFIKDRTGASKKAALAKLNMDEKGLAAAKASRPDPLPAENSHAQNVAEVVHATRANAPPVTDMIGQRVATLERKLQYVRSPQERARLQRRISALSQRQDTELETRRGAAPRGKLSWKAPSTSRRLSTHPKRPRKWRCVLTRSCQSS